MKKDYYVKRRLRSLFLFLCLVLCMTPLVRIWTNHTLERDYASYKASMIPGSDVPGEPANGDTPQARSLAEVESLHLFTCIVPSKNLN